MGESTGTVSNKASIPASSVQSASMKRTPSAGNRPEATREENWNDYKQVLYLMLKMVTPTFSGEKFGPRRIRNTAIPG